MKLKFDRRVAALGCALLAAVAIVFTLWWNAGGVVAAFRTPESGVVRATLANGLRVVIVRNTLAPVVATAVNYLSGGAETEPGFPGTAHALEHMMFRGSPGLTADQLADIGSAMGGDFNANTRETITQYLFTAPAEDLDIALHIEAQRMSSILATDEDWAQERGAIEQEVAQDLSNPVYVFLTKVRTAMFAGTPYANDALGTRESFAQTKAADLKRYHERWYAPNNAVLVVAGNVDPAAALAKIKELFGPIRAKELPARTGVTLQPVQPQAINLKTDLPYGMQVIALRMPGFESPDYPALEVLADVLNNRRGDFYGLVPQGKALSVEFSYSPLPKAGLAYAVGSFPAGGNAKAIESEMREILGRIARDGVPPDLVAAAKREERRGAEFQKNSISGLATVWSEAVAVQGLTSPDEDLARIERVTVADVNRVARKYLDLDHAITGVLTPEGSGKPVAARGFGGQEHISLGEAKPTPLPEWAQPVLRRLTVPQSSVHPVVSKLKNGITLIVQPEDVSDTVSVYGHIRNRSELQVPPGKEGLSQVLAQLFAFGTQRLDRIAYQEALDAIGAEAQAGTDFSVQSLSENFERGVELLADNQLHPALPEAAFNIVRRQIAQSVAGQLTSPDYLGTRALRAALFPAGDPTLREARPETVSALLLADVQDYYRKAFRPDLTVIVVIGKVTPAHAQAVIEKYFGAWSASGPPPVTDLPRVPLNRAAISAVPDASRVQDRVILAQTLDLTRSDPGYYALQLGNSVLGGSFYASRLTRDIRKEAGLVYNVQSSLQVGKTRSLYLIEYACDPQNVSRVQDMVERELRAMRDSAVTAAEFERAKALRLHSIPLQEESAGEIALGLVQRWTLGLPLDEPTNAARRYLALTPADVQAAFAKWVRADALVRVTMGPAPK